ncbi:MMPL family transporter [Millisia brevis]|uniref:MMPL family transporter n=1 Tax=Millisia brevis TaxID=264148 RepID=UPI00083479E3|nr:MMPL family transporter [Millisia brevis]
MATYLYRLGSFAYRRKYLVVGVWILAFAAILGTVAATDPQTSNNFSLPGTDSQRATDLMAEDFPAISQQQEQASTSVLIHADDGLAAHDADIDALIERLRTLPDLANGDALANPVTVAEQAPEQAASVLGDDGRVGLIQVTQSIPMADQSTESVDEFKQIIADSSVNGLQVEGTGSLMTSGVEGSASEAIGFAVAFVVMIIAFGALVASFIPIITALVGVAISLNLLTLGAAIVDVNEMVSMIASMIGIAVAIDYSLFIVSRYRNELNTSRSRADAAGRAVGTAGSSVVFAGLTVVIALTALTIVGVPFISQMGIGAAIAVIVSVLCATTLIPAVLGIFGRFAFAGRIPGIRHGDEPDSKESNGHRWAKFAVRRPLPVALAGLAVLAVAAVPMTRMELGMSFTPDAQRPALELMRTGFGEGVNGPLFVVLSGQDGQDIAPAADDAISFIQGLNNVADPGQLMWTGNGTGAMPSQEGATSALIRVTPQTAPSSTETHDLMEAIRAHADTSSSQFGVELGVAGETAILSDMSSKLDSALIPYLIVVVGLAFLILMLVFRSILVPLTATLGFLFSVCATFGVTVAIFQEGWGGLIQYPLPIISFLPIFLVGMVFGLAMDYQVFLVTRMREEYVHGASAKDAIVTGFQHGARVVTSAAIIMISVFAAFMLSPDTVGKMMGFALAAAVFFDAFIIRMMVIPAVMSMLGDRAWWLPAWLDRILPNVDVEGEKLRLELDARDLALDSDRPVNV